MRDLSGSLRDYLASRYPGAELEDFEFLTSGFESDVYALALRLPGELLQRLILRLYPGEGATAKMVKEGEGLLRLHEAGFPAPALFLFEPDPAYLGKPFSIIEKLEGRPLWSVLAGAEPVLAQDYLEKFGGLIAHLHRLDWRPFTPKARQYQVTPVQAVRDVLAAFRLEYIRFGVPGFLAILDWFESRLPEIQVRPAVVHLDLHANNVFLGHDGRLALIDWTQIAVTDYRLDLTWTLLIMGDFGQPAWSEQILQAYRRAAGYPVDQLDYFNVLTWTKLLASRIIGLKTDPAQLGMRPETAQSLEQQRPVLKLLSERIRDLTGLTVSEVDTLVG